MKKIRTIIADDEPAARGRIARSIVEDPNVELICECRNGPETVEAVRKHKPDLLFLDVQMPHLNGFQVVDQLATDRVPYIIFVTAFDQYALKAFDVHAVDYLLKPYDDERLLASIERAKTLIDMGERSELSSKFMDLVREHMRSRSDFIEQFTIKEKGREYKVPVEDIIYLKAEGNYLCLKLRDRQFLYRMTMNAVATELDPAHFLRIHRSYIVNLDHLQGVRYSGNNEFIFMMGNNERMISGRSYKEDIARCLEQMEKQP